MNGDFCKLMEIIKKEAEAGAFSTKGDAVRRRDELIKKTPAETAEPAAVAPAAAAERDEAPHGTPQASIETSLDTQSADDVW